MRLAAQERRREGNEPQTTKVAHHAAYPRHEGFEVEIQDEDAAPVGTSSERLKAVEFGVVPAVSRLQPSDVGLDGVGGAAGGVSGGQGMEVEVMDCSSKVLTACLCWSVGVTVFLIVLAALNAVGIMNLTDTEVEHAWLALISAWGVSFFGLLFSVS